MNRVRACLTLIVCAVALGSTTSAVAAPRPQIPKGERGDLRFPGADTIELPDGSGFVSYGASTGGVEVPYAVSGGGATPEGAVRATGDAMPTPGAWVKPGGKVWAPGAWYKVKKGTGWYYLFYTAPTHSGRKCIGVARSTSPYGPFSAQARPLVCATKGSGGSARWVIDADVADGPGRGSYLTYRDGQHANGTESAISAIKLTVHDDGHVSTKGSPRVILRSGKLRWAHFRDGRGVTVIENPSTVYWGGAWYLFYSGNSWPTNYYGTGIAYCGAELADGPCTPIPGPGRAYFSYAGPQAHLPGSMRKSGLPGNKRGPGAMAVFSASDGSLWVVWNYISDAYHRGRRGGHIPRYSRFGRLLITGSGTGAGFKVVAH